MQQRRLRVGFFRYPYSGNGGVSSEVPDIADWLIGVVARSKSDGRIEDIVYDRLSDTPIPMSRNDSVHWAQQAQVDVLVMIDSDMFPDMYVGSDPLAKQFFESSFDFIYDNWEKGPHIVVSPYCGPPPHPIRGGEELVYVFRWTSYETLATTWPVKLEPYSRMEAAKMTGISEVDAGPTGLCMIDMRVFEHLSHPYFDYEWEGDGPQCPACRQSTPGPRRRKASTEDCFFFRNVALGCSVKLGYNPVYCNWDAWSGHWKPKCVGKPSPVTTDMVGRHLQDAVLSGVRSDTRLIQVGKPIVEPDGPVASVPGRIENDPNIRIEPGIAFTPKQPGTVMSHAECQQMVDGFQSIGQGTNVELWYGTATPGPEDLGHKTHPDTLQALSTLVERHCRQIAGSTDASGNAKKIQIVELGSWVGKSAVAIVLGVPHGREYEVHCIDKFAVPTDTDADSWVTRDMYEAVQKAIAAGDPDPVLNHFKKNTAPVLNKRVFYHRNSTTEAAKRWTKPIDILFIDAAHTFEAVIDDINNWAQFVKPGGLIIGDDWCSDEVRRAVLLAFPQSRVKAMNNLWYATK